MLWRAFFFMNLSVNSLRMRLEICPRDRLSLLVSRRKIFPAGLGVILNSALPARGVSGTSPVLVAGASGRSGFEVVRALRESSRFVPVLQVRDAAKLPNESTRGVKTFSCDVTAPDAASSIARALMEFEVQDVICTLGYVPTYSGENDRRGMEAVDHLGVNALIEAAETVRLPGRFVLVSSLLVPVLEFPRMELPPPSQQRQLEITSPSEPRELNLSARMLNSLGGVLDAKAASEARLRASKTLDWTIIRPGVFADSRQGSLLVGDSGRFVGDSGLDSRGLGPPVPRCKSPFFASSGAVCGITRAQLGDACVLALTDRDASRRTFEVVSRPDAPPLVRNLLSASVIGDH